LTFCVCRICKIEGVTDDKHGFIAIPGFRLWICSECHTRLKAYFTGKPSIIGEATK
tara:strand:- start:417 stop:584 length:168 start_codon:yes stop_codon:yes gene_type:complete